MVIEVILKNELEKISNYLFDKKIISLKEISALNKFIRKL